MASLKRKSDGSMRDTARMESAIQRYYPVSGFTMDAEDILSRLQRHDTISLRELHHVLNDGAWSNPSYVPKPVTIDNFPKLCLHIADAADLEFMPALGDYLSTAKQTRTGCSFSYGRPTSTFAGHGRLAGC